MWLLVEGLVEGNQGPASLQMVSRQSQLVHSVHVLNQEPAEWLVNLTVAMVIGDWWGTKIFKPGLPYKSRGLINLNCANQLKPIECVPGWRAVRDHREPHVQVQLLPHLKEHSHVAVLHLTDLVDGEEAFLSLQLGVCVGSDCWDVWGLARFKSRFGRPSTCLNRKTLEN